MEAIALHTALKAGWAVFKKVWPYITIMVLAAALVWTRHDLKTARLERDVYLEKAVDYETKYGTLKQAVDAQSAVEEARRIDEARTAKINGTRFTDIQSMEQKLKELENAKPVGEVHPLSPSACTVLRSVYGPEACTAATDHN